jgi:transposase
MAEGPPLHHHRRLVTTADAWWAFFNDLGEERAGQLTHVSADGAEWIHDVVRERVLRAVICLDPFHMAKWATEALEKLSRRLVAQLRADGTDRRASTIKHTGA